MSEPQVYKELELKFGCGKCMSNWWGGCPARSSRLLRNMTYHQYGTEYEAP